MLGALRKAAGNVGRFLSTTGKSALQKVGQTAQTIRKVGSAINTATGGAAGAAWQAKVIAWHWNNHNEFGIGAQYG
jgi:hypothetical protein